VSSNANERIDLTCIKDFETFRYLLVRVLNLYLVFLSCSCIHLRHAWICLQCVHDSSVYV